jgi:hypothetical protein
MLLLLLQWETPSQILFFSYISRQPLTLLRQKEPVSLAKPP